MKVHSIADVAAAVRGHRLDRGLSQAALASRSGISRKWISEFESGKTTVELALVIRILDALDLRLDLTEIHKAPADPVDLDALLEEYRNE